MPDPPPSPIENLRERIAALTEAPASTSRQGLPAAISVAAALGSGGLLGWLAGLGTAGSSIASWLSNRQQEEFNQRVQDICFRISDILDAHTAAGARTYPNDNWAENASSILLLAARTPSADKRERYAALLARGALMEDPGHRDTMRTMALILDQLEYKHVLMLDRLLQAPGESMFDGIWGVTRTVVLGNDLVVGGTGELLTRLEAAGLLRVGDTATRSPSSLNKQVLVSALGLQFHEWLTNPSAVAR